LEKIKITEIRCGNCETQIACKNENGAEPINRCKPICNIILNVGYINSVMRIFNNLSFVPNFYSAITIYNTNIISMFYNCTLINLNIGKNEFMKKHILH
ncbi:hypothetical protein PVMG_05121, partial [Plasmodium vivax Mauritania I]